MSAKVHLTIQSHALVWRVALICVAIELSFVFLDWLINYQRGIDISQIRRLFNIAREDGLAGWFAVFQTMFVAMVLWFITYILHVQGMHRWKVFGWGFLALFFSMMAIDDGAVVHERLGSAFKAVMANGQSDSFGASLLSFFPSYSWQLILLPFFSLVGLFMLIFVWLEVGDKAKRKLLVLSFVPLVMAVGLDFIEGLDVDHAWNIQTFLVHDYDTTTYTISHFSKSCEEFLEMLGNTMFLYLFMTHAFFVIREGLSISVQEK
ncbi:MAG: hypothetical protein Q9M28_01530 [Mariprofundaceae bacterium]|nr:hypothetical protein [Mariprofundaceae bacterium]